MERPIIGFHRDEQSDWVADLSCGHGRHVRNDPPFTERPWVESEAGRSEWLGTPLDCVRCDRREMPEGHAPHRRTETFTEDTVPNGLLRAHNTKVGVWGVIHVLEGRLRYDQHAPFDTSETLSPGTNGLVLPQVLHEVAPDGSVQFYVEFWRRAVSQ